LTVALAFDAVDESANRPDLARRRETKHCFARQDTATLRAVLRAYAEPVVHSGPVSTVRSVYFDDTSMSACHANLNGVPNRKKVRVRWYDEESPTGACFVEIKWREGNATGKHRFRVDAGAALAELPLRLWPGVLAAALPAGFSPVLERFDRATALVEYRREHYVLGDTRFTLDYDLQFFPLVGRRHLARRFGERLRGFALIEQKAPLEGASDARRVLDPLRSRATGFSKYVTACRTLGYVSSL
jgi:hypothetical protein